MKMEVIADQPRAFGIEPFDSVETDDLNSRQPNRAKDELRIKCKISVTETLDKWYMEHGCSHYRRRCHIGAPYCNEVFDCRHFHNEAKECGRAGKDGKPSSCILYYNHSDYHMISQGASEQNSWAPGSSRPAMKQTERILETNTENLLRMVSYCENDVDCRRFLQLVHFGEKFDSFTCKKTCDNCTNTQNCIEKHVTNTQLEKATVASNFVG